MALFKKFFLDMRENSDQFDKNANGVFQSFGKKLLVRGLNAEEGIKNLFLFVTSYQESTVMVAPFRSANYFGKPILIRQTERNAYFSADVFVWLTDEQGSRFVNLRFYKPNKHTVW